MKKRLLTVAVLSANLFLIGCADEQARAQIADLNSRVAQLQSSLGTVSNKVSNQKPIDTLNKLDDLQSQIEGLNGSVSTITNNQKTYQTTQDQLNQSLQQQIQVLQQATGQKVFSSTRASASSDVEASAPAVDTQNTATATSEQNSTPAKKVSNNGGAQLKSAFNKIKKHDFPGAIKQLKSIITTSNNPNIVASATYYLSVAYAANGQYKESISTARKYIVNNPNGHDAPNAMRTIYIAQSELGMKKSAAKTAKDLIKQYPDSEAAKKMQSEGR